MTGNRKLLLITTFYRAGEKIYPLIPILSKYFEIHVFHYMYLSKNTELKFENDYRPLFDKKYKKYISKEYHAPGYERRHSFAKVMKDFFRSSFIEILRDNNYEVVLWDNNVRHHGTRNQAFYRYVGDNCRIFSSPHGSKDLKSKYIRNIIWSLGQDYDIVFTIGEKEKKECINYVLNNDDLKHRKMNNIIPAGIPSNDDLINYERNNKYILLIMNFSGDKLSRCPFYVFNKRSFYKLGILKVAERYGYKIVIKEKVREIEKTESLKKSLDCDVEFIDMCKDDNKLIADAALVISAPSTMALKPIQLGIPTVVLKGYGEEGLFYDYDGFVDPSYQNIVDSLERQKDNGRSVNFIKKTITGGLEYNSTELYLREILRYCEND